MKNRRQIVQAFYDVRSVGFSLSQNVRLCRWSVSCRDLMLVAAVCLAFSTFAAFAQSAVLPSPRDFVAPDPEPAAPAGWDRFSPPVVKADALPLSPNIAEWTRAAGPDDSLILTGEGFSGLTGAEEGKDTEFLVYGQTSSENSVLAPVRIQRLEGLKAAISLPLSLPSWSTYFVWPKNAAGYGSPVAVNRTEIWWLSRDDKVTRGDSVSVYGRNLAHDDGVRASWVYLKPAGVSGMWVPTTSVNPYRVQFAVPQALANGTYEVWVHNGHGGSYGWSGPLSLNVTETYSRNGSTFNVRDYGAIADGVADDTDAIVLANNAALIYRDRTGLHPTLYFPAGTYLLRRGLGLEHDFLYLGDGRDRTVFKCHPSFKQTKLAGDPGGGNLGLLIGNGGNQHDIEIRGLTLDVTSNFRADGVEGWPLYGGWSSGADISLVDLRIKTNSQGGCARIQQTTRLIVTGCEFVGGELFLYHDRGVEISNCLFLNANYQMASVHELTTSNFSITNCRFQDLDIDVPSGRGQGRLLAGSANQGAQYHAYIGDNVTVDLGPEPGDNAGEQILCEGNLNTYDWGHPVTAKPGAVTFNAKLTTDYRSVVATAVIVAGKGLGQYRLVTGWDGDKTITVSPNWNVTPDVSSEILLEAGTYRWSIYHNTLDGKSHYASAYTAMTAIEPYGGCYDWVVDNNSITHMRTALYVAAVQDFVHTPQRIHPCFFHTYENNLIQSCYRGIIAGCGSTGSNEVDPGIGFIGTVFRHNILKDLVDLGAGETTFQTTGAATLGYPFDLTLFEHNLFTNVVRAFDCDLDGPARVKNTLAYKNVFDRGAASPVNSVGTNFGGGTVEPVFSENTWIGFATIFGGTVPDSVLATSQLVEKPKSLKVQIWNY